MNSATLSRIERVKKLQRDERRAELVRAESALHAAEDALQARSAEHARAADTFRAVVVLTPAELELGARHLTETSAARARAESTRADRDRQRAAASSARIDAERDVRAIDLARVRLTRIADVRAARSEAQILELRAARPR